MNNYIYAHYLSLKNEKWSAEYDDNLKPTTIIMGVRIHCHVFPLLKVAGNHTRLCLFFR